jgi:catechol 2,3-dioxygenase-like lactoylglutathione lyase family enzyme
VSRLLSVALAALGERWRREAYRFVGIGANMKLAVNLLVLRCKDIEVTRRFYEQLGLSFVEEKHGTRPQHYAWESGGFVLELYPAAEGQAPDNVRIGFSTPLLADLSGNLRHSSDMNIVKQPYAVADRLVMLLEDPDGRKVELSQPLHR